MLFHHIGHLQLRKNEKIMIGGLFADDSPISAPHTYEADHLAHEGYPIYVQYGNSGGWQSNDISTITIALHSHHHWGGRDLRYWLEQYTDYGKDEIERYSYGGHWWKIYDMENRDPIWCIGQRRDWTLISNTENQFVPSTFFVYASQPEILDLIGDFCYRLTPEQLKILHSPFFELEQELFHDQFLGLSALQEHQKMMEVQNPQYVYPQLNILPDDAQYQAYQTYQTYLALRQKLDRLSNLHDYADRVAYSPAHCGPMMPLSPYRTGLSHPPLSSAFIFFVNLDVYYGVYRAEETVQRFLIDLGVPLKLIRDHAAETMMPIAYRIVFYSNDEVGQSVQNAPMPDYHHHALYPRPSLYERLDREHDETMRDIQSDQSSTSLSHRYHPLQPLDDEDQEDEYDEYDE